MNSRLPEDGLTLPQGRPNVNQASTSNEHNYCQSTQTAGRPLHEENETPRSTINPEIDQSQQNRTRKRVRNVDKWKQNVRKLQRNSGKTYINRKGVVVEAKKFKGGECPCPIKCHEKVSNEQCKRIFSEYYDLADHNLQTAFLHSRVKVINKQRVYTKTNSEKRQNTRIYSLVKEDGGEAKVCKSFFKKVLAVSDGRITRALSNKNKSITPPRDKRGTAKKSYKKTPEVKIQKIVEFINKFPPYTSHYSRKKNPNRKYLSPSLNKTILYNLYNEQNPDHKVSPYIFSGVFDTKFNLHFHAPITDSCRKCDNFNVKLKATQISQQGPIKVQQELHWRQAELKR